MKKQIKPQTVPLVDVLCLLQNFIPCPYLALKSSGMFHAVYFVYFIPYHKINKRLPCITVAHNGFIEDI